MWRVFATAVVTASLTGAIAFVWWGLPLQRLRDDVDTLFHTSRVTKQLCAEFGNALAPRPEQGSDGTLVTKRRR